METTKLNKSGATNSVPEKAEKVKDFDAVKRAFETAYTSGKDYGKELMELAQACAYSTVKKCIDPQRKTAPQRDTVSNNGINPVMVDLRRGIARDVKALDMTAQNANKATRATLDADGDPTTEVVDKDAENALADLIEETLSDGIDLVQEAVTAILEQAINHAYGPEWLDRPYTMRKLDKRVYIHLEDSAAYKDVETAPIQEVFRAVRRAIASSRAVQTDPRNGYTYIEDMTSDGLDTVLYRMDKYADIGGTDCSGLYTADIETARDISDILDNLALTKRQEQIVRLRMRGMGYKAIATYLGVKEDGIKVQLRRLRKKCEEIGFTPEMWREMTENN